MSAAYEVKKTIMESQYKNQCCRRALLQGILASKAVLDEKNRICVTFETEEQVAFFGKLVFEFYNKELAPISSQKGGRGKKVAFDSKAARNFIISIDSDSPQLYSEKCQGCTAAFLRGVFFATGRYTDPTKHFCLEFSLGSRVFVISDRFTSLGFEMKQTSRKSETLLYTKNSGVIEDFFATCDLNDTAYEIMNIKIRNEFMNNANRLRNSDTGNIAKSVEAASPQLSVIKELEEFGLLARLPDELAETAKLRLEYPDLSLIQLARISVPPISKSGITHRMAKIVKLGKELITKHKLQ